MELLKCIARLFSRNRCASRIAGKALHQSKRHLLPALIVLGLGLELSQLGLQQSNSLTVISFESQVRELDAKGVLIISRSDYF